MKELETDEMKAIDGGFWWIPEIIFAGLVKELITEGFEKCINDFKEGYDSAYAYKK